MEPVQKFLPLLVYAVNYCPQSEQEWQEASAKLNCTSNSLQNRYHCVPNHELTSLLEFCYDTNRILVPKRRCLELADSGTLDAAYNCTNTFTSGCPAEVYFSDELYKHEACTKINTQDSCFLADPKCPKEIRSTTMKIMIKSTTSNEATDTGTTDIPLTIIGWTVAGILAIVIVVFCSWKYREKCKRGSTGERIQEERNGQDLNASDETQRDNMEIEATEKTAFIAHSTGQMSSSLGSTQTNCKNDLSLDVSFQAQGVQDVDGSESKECRGSLQSFEIPISAIDCSQEEVNIIKDSNVQGITPRRHLAQENTQGNRSLVQKRLFDDYQPRIAISRGIDHADDIISPAVLTSYSPTGNTAELELEEGDVVFNFSNGVSLGNSYIVVPQRVQRNGFHDLVFSLKRKLPSESDLVKRRRIQSPNVRKMVAAIDIGTTYSGYCYSFHDTFSTDPLKINVHKWKTANTKLESLKTPTTLLLNRNRKCLAFGYDADAEYAELAEQDEHEECYYFRRFKMGLKRVERSLTNETMFDDIAGKRLDAMSVFKKTIEFLKDHMLKDLKDNNADVIPSEIYWVMTVPAVWGDDEKQFILQAANRAGISNLVITEEAKAVAFYCKYLPMEKMEFAGGKRAFSPATRYLVLDAGGGTVDITVHKVDFDGSLKELSKSEGPYGGITVDNNFKQLLEDIVGKEFLDEYSKSETADYIELWQNFETRKRLVRDDTPGVIVVKMPISLTEKYEKKKNEPVSNVLSSKEYHDLLTWDVADKLKIKKKLFVSFYQTAYMGIINLVEEVLKDKNVFGTKTIIMVGGFSESPLLQKKIKDSLNDCSVIIPQEPGLAVLKGAVLYGHQPHVYPLTQLHTRPVSC